MMQWLSSAWLFAAASVVFPILLHLWSRGERRRVQVGSVRLLGEAANRRARRLRPNELLLLALRCALLIALACALAEPRWWSAPELSEDRVELRLDGESWSRLAEADLALPPGTAIDVVAVDRDLDFQGRRPTLRRPFTWTSTPAVETSSAAAASAQIGIRIEAHPSRTEDAQYLDAGLSVAAESLGLERVYGDDLLVFLTPESTDQDACRGARLVLSDGGERFSSANRLVGEIELRRIYEIDEITSGTIALLRDGRGTPILTERRLGEAQNACRHVQWHGRFHPSSTSLVEDPLFVFWLRDLLAETFKPPRGAVPFHPQDVPHRGDAGSSPRPHAFPESFFWGLAVVFFAAERFLAARGAAG